MTAPPDIAAFDPPGASAEAADGDGLAPGVRSPSLDRLVEALLFEATAALSSADVAALATRGLARPVTADEAAESVARLRIALADRASALDVFAWAGGWRLATRADLAPALDAARTTDPRPRALSAALLETLAIVAYKQPVTRAEVEHVRGADCDYALARLVGLGLVDPVGRGDGVGRPMLYGTTARFLDTFGLAALEDLPAMRDVESLLADPAFSSERARLLTPSSLLSDSPPSPADVRTSPPDAPDFAGATSAARSGRTPADSDA